MKLSYLIKRLQVLKSQIKGDPDVIIDHEEDGGYYNMEKVQIVNEDETVMINLKSSNEN